MKQPRIRDVAAGSRPLHVVVTWADDSVSEIDLSEPIGRLKVLRPLRRKGKFSQVKAGEWGWSIAWADDMEIGADTLWRMAQEQAGNFVPASVFQAWRARNRLSLSGAARLLGLSRRMIAYYDSGQRPIPKLVGLACQGVEAQLDRSRRNGGRHAA